MSSDTNRFLGADSFRGRVRALSTVMKMLGKPTDPPDLMVECARRFLAEEIEREELWEAATVAANQEAGT